MVAAHSEGVFFPNSHVIDCEFLSGLSTQLFHKLPAGVVIRGPGPNLYAVLLRP
jgi:hypothetical protein